MKQFSDLVLDQLFTSRGKESAKIDTETKVNGQAGFWRMSNRCSEILKPSPRRKGKPITTHTGRDALPQLPVTGKTSGIAEVHFLEEVDPTRWTPDGEPIIDLEGVTFHLSVFF